MEETLNLPNENPVNPSDFDCVRVADTEPENASLLLGSMDYTEIVGTYEMRKRCSLRGRSLWEKSPTL